MMERKLLEAELPDAAWRKSSRSTEGCCIEVALLSGGHVALRDDKASDGPVLIVTPDAWAAFAAAMSDGEFAF